MRINWNIVGTICFSILIGIFIGVSQSPVVGIVITSIAGLITTFLSLKSEKSINIFEGQKLGKFLTLFAIFSFIGVLIGYNLQKKSPAPPKTKEEKVFEYPWSRDTIPDKIDEALRWAFLNHLMNDLGYNNSQVKELYAIYKNSEKQIVKPLINTSDTLEYPTEPPPLNPYDSPWGATHSTTIKEPKKQVTMINDIKLRTIIDYLNVKHQSGKSDHKKKASSLPEGFEILQLPSYTSD